MHRPVLLKEAISSLNLKEGHLVLDATVGGGGHAREILKKILPGGRLIGIDVDESVLKTAEGDLEEFKGHFKLLKTNFKYLDVVLSKENITNLDAVIFDLGISSYQIEEAGRGFSVRQNGPLDMRMGSDSKLTAYDIVNRYSQEELSDIISKFGEERLHNRIARYIVSERSKKPIETTFDLVRIVHRAAGYRRGRIDPATRTFQALRIAVNDELGALEKGLKTAISWLERSARIAVISFHSLEDRVVKNLFKGYSALGVLRILTKKPMRPSREEVLSNPRSRSARLRVAERIG